jgi:hypothetical protein
MAPRCYTDPEDGPNIKAAARAGGRLPSTIQ